MEENNTTNPTPAQTKSPAKMLTLLAVIAVVGILAYTTLNKPQTNSEVVNDTPLPTTVTQTETSPTTDNAMVTTINMDAGAFYYTPSEIRVKKGETVKIVMTSKDMMHDFKIDELGVALPITQSGETNTVEFTPNQTGTFEYYCSVGQHRARGQVGKIIVE